MNFPKHQYEVLDAEMPDEHERVACGTFVFRTCYTADTYARMINQIACLSARVAGDAVHWEYCGTQDGASLTTVVATLAELVEEHSIC